MRNIAKTGPTLGHPGVILSLGDPRMGVKPPFGGPYVWGQGDLEALGDGRD